MDNTEPFASVAELQAFWRPLSQDEQNRANVMLVMASDRLRLMGEDLGVDVDARFNSSNPYKSTVKWVVMSAVKRALATPIDSPPVNSYQQTAGPYSENYTFANPGGDLWFSKKELAQIGLYGKQIGRGISTSREDIYS